MRRYPSEPFNLAGRRSTRRRLCKGAFLIAILALMLVETVAQTDRDSLISFYNSTNGDNWKFNNGWKDEPTLADGFNVDPCGETFWSGVSCTGGRVTSLTLPRNRLAGELPAELGNLGNLQTLSLGQNQLTGSIPPELGDLASLLYLWLNSNQLTGPIPAELGNLADLRIMELQSNQLTGPIPAGLGKLANLQFMDLQSNQLTEEIPAELGNLANLGHLDLHNNLLMGEIPPELGNLANLWYLDLRTNQLMGQIPAELGNLARLTSLYLQNNQLTGEIPAELGNLANLLGLGLRDNQLTGRIPPDLGNLTKLTSLSLENNQLTGEIPLELGSLPELQQLNLSSNQLMGPIPSDLGGLADLVWLFLNNNQLTGSIPAELGNLSGLLRLRLDYNQLSGEIPASLGQLSKLRQGDGLDLRFNHLFTDNNSLREFLNSKQSGGDWEGYQTLHRYFAQFGDGGGLFSQVVLISLNDVSAATGEVEILGASGDGLSVDLNGETVVGMHDLSVPPTGLLSLRTDGQGGVQQGSVRVTTDRHVEGVVIFGGRFGLAGVGSSPDCPSGFVAPMQRNESRDINTGVAVTVLSDEDAALDLTLLDGTGSAIAEASDMLVAQGHDALYVTGVQWDEPVDFSDFTGALVVTASQPVTATVIQTLRGEFVTMPVAPLQAPQQQVAAQPLPAQAEHRLYFAQFADGAGALSSQILLLNLSDEEAAQVQIALRNDPGEPLTVDLEGEEVTGEKQVEIGPRALRVLATDGQGDLQEGSVSVVSDRPLAGVIIFSGPDVGAAGVGNSVELPEGFVAPMETDEAGGINTGVALMSLEAEELTIDAELLASDGQVLATAQLSLAGMGHEALFVTEFQWDSPVDFSRFEGLLRVRAGGRTAAMVIQTRRGQFATMPVAPKPAN